MFLQRCRLAIALTCALLLALPAVAAATYRGTNGKLAFASDRNGTFDIYSVSSTGSTLPPTPLTHSSALESEPAWSPDGSQIAFSFVSGGFGNVFVMNADGTGVRNVTNQVDSFNTKPTWSPDGSKIAFYSNRDGDNEIYVVRADGSGPQTDLTNDHTGRGLRARLVARRGQDRVHEIVGAARRTSTS